MTVVEISNSKAPSIVEFVVRKDVKRTKDYRKLEQRARAMVRDWTWP